jgi:hypothetical protein
MLKNEKLNRMGEWIKKNARPLEIARYEYHFENGSKENVLRCLSQFQNADGGFGHGLEADNWNPNSTPLTSSVALKILYETGFRKTNDVIDKCMDYLSSNYFDNQKGTWATIIPSNNNYAHAPWWTWEEGGGNTWEFNPSIEIAGFMVYYSDEDTLSSKIANLCFEKAEEYLYSENKLSKNFHEIYCYLHGLLLANRAENKVLVNIKPMEDKIKEYIDATVCRDSHKWLTSYVAQPIDFMNLINDDDLLIVQGYRNEMVKNAQLLIDALPMNGVWDITWTWNGNYPEVFEKTKVIWQAVFAIERLLKFRRLGLIEGVT